ncbi:MAG TPA: protein-glutamine glutaminase family protein [Bacteriovoracaceae bacterium]|nr:protein-glutamine glutaminase family protein [Bacteriovoracaceae bacterium]
MWFLVLCSMVFSFASNATVTVQAKIYDIDYGRGVEDPFLMLTSGHIAWIKKSSNKSVVGLQRLDVRSTETMKFTINDSNELVAAHRLPQKLESTAHTKSLNFNFDEVYSPTILESLEVAKTYFKESRDIQQNSQCFNRAHVWGYEWYKNHEVLSNKTWIFFTRRYIRKFNHKWWFHVSPSVAVKEGSVVREKVMDQSFSRGPLNIKQWTDIFIKDGSSCREVKKYTDYANYPESGNCFTMRSSMFYHQPFDLESTETWNTVKTNWYDEDLKQAYLDTFNEEF